MGLRQRGLLLRSQAAQRHLRDSNQGAKRRALVV
jgi:hypothetical protein